MMQTSKALIINSIIDSELSKLIGSDEALKTKMYFEATDNGSFNIAFVRWYQRGNQTSKVPNINTHSGRIASMIAKYLRDFYYSNHPSIKAFARYTLKTDNSSVYGYSSTKERKAGKTFVANILLDNFNAIQEAGVVIKKDKLNHYLNKAKSTWRNIVFDYAAKLTNKNKADIILKYNEATDPDAYLDKLLGGKLKSITAANLLAVYRELHGSRDHAIKYINEIFASTPKLVDVLHEVRDDLDTEISRIAADEQNNVLGESVEDESDGQEQDDNTDSGAIARTDHSGIYSSYLTHVSVRVRNYFNSLKKLKSPTVGDYDTENTYGLPETMDATECIAMLYNNGDFHDVESFTKQIRHIGQTIRGFEAFVQLADNLEANYDLATEMFTIFTKVKMTKVETVVEDGKTITKISNRRANMQSALFLDLLDDIKSTVINNNPDVVKNKLNELRGHIRYATTFNKTVNDNRAIPSDKVIAKRELLEELQLSKEVIVKLVKSYYPSVEESAILSYIEIGNDNNTEIENQINRIQILALDIESTIKASGETITNYNNMLRLAAEIDEYNNNLRKEQAANRRWISPSEFKSKKAIYSDDYIQPQISSVISIVNKLVNFSIVKTNFNNRNVHGKNNSDIINSSHLTNLYKMLGEFYKDDNSKLRNKALEAWGIDKLKTSQYKYNNLLVQQIDEETGEVLNPGTALFSYINGELCLTDNADKILNINLFNGASNRDNDNNALYAEMLGDFGPTAFINFFKDVDKSSLANYFTRTPSDAPKTFVIGAPKYSTWGLFKMTNYDQVRNSAKKLAYEVGNPVTFKEWRERYRNTSISDADSDVSDIKDSEDITDYLIPKKHILVSNALSIRKVDPKNTDLDNYEAYVSFYTKDGIAIVLKGTINKAGKGQALDNATLEAISSVAHKNEKQLPDRVEDILYDYYFDNLSKGPVKVGDTVYDAATFEVDTQENTFKMLKNQFKQELLDAAVALNHYFEVVEIGHGVYELKKGSDAKGRTIPIFKANRGHGQGYENYHLDEDGKIFVQTKNGVKFGGNVFHSNKFTLVRENDKGELYKKNYLDEIINNGDNSINFLYGEALRFKLNSDGKVTDVVLNDKQSQLIDTALSEYIKDYCDKAYSKMMAYSDSLVDIDVNRYNATNFAINYLLMHFTYDALLEGNSKFYKNTQTLLKRAKETQGSGVPYGIANYNAGFRPSLNPVKTYSYLNSGKTTVNVTEEYTDAKGRVRTRIAKDDNGNDKTEEITIQELFNRYGYDIQQREGFTGVTIYNSVATNEEALNLLKKQLVKNGLTEDAALDLLYGPLQYDDNGDVIVDKVTGDPVRRGGYTKTKVNDAQSYITFEEWVRRIAARGQLQRYMPLIKKLIDPNSILSASDIKEFMQVQKNFYYDLYYDEEYGMEVPRNIKNAEYVLLPRLVKGTQLEQVYYAMKKAGIDQLNTKETSKAANAEVLRLWDNDGNLTTEDIAKFTDRASQIKQIFSYNNLYTQQETPQHMNAKNKAGIQIMKKLMDNLPSIGELGRLKSQFFSLYSANIAESCERLLKQFDVPVDENGNIELDETGNIKGLDKRVFYSKLRDELAMLGMDKNALDYVTIPSDSTDPIMPAFRTNYITKFESVVQSIFNSSITRQKLPGFHAAQVTNIGWKPMSEHLDTVTYDKELKYHPIQYKDKNDKVISWREYEALSNEDKAKYEKTDPAPYIEVMLPASFLGVDRNSAHYRKMSDEAILKELQAEGLDTVIGYRIPTEGKQSVCIMKVVGLLSDANGSTIVVPNDWVSQTGSGFGIDSVYGIQYETYRDRRGRVRKLAYKDELDKYDWFEYIRDIKDIYEEDVSESIKAIKTAIKADLSKQRKAFDEEEQVIWKSLNELEQQFIKDYNGEIDVIIDKEGIEDKHEATLRRYELLLPKLDRLIARGERKGITEPIARLKALRDNIDNTRRFISGRSEEYSDRTKKDIDNFFNDIATSKKYNDLAKKAGLMTLEEFTNPENVIKANGTRRRNTAILDVMIKVLSNPETLEENLSRSNCDDFTYWKKKLANKNVKTALEGRSPYDIFDQIAYQEEAVSGIKLKAISVALDTFCSVCNTVRPTLTKPIYIVYDEKDINKKVVKDRFDSGKVTKDGFAVRHSYYGWSKDNRNSCGKLLTAYSSQTTAFCLDNIKEGSLPNLNAYTFSVFKTLANSGCDFQTAIGFILQPGVTEIVNAYNRNKSIYNKIYENPVHQAVYCIAERLGVNVYNDKVTYVSIHKPVAAVIAALNIKYGEKFADLFQQNEDEEVSISLNRDKLTNLPLLVSKMRERLDKSGSSSPVKESDLLFDLGVILSYKYIQDTANEIGDYARCCNPDKFGAKQSIFATRQVFKNLQDLIFKTEEATVYDEDGNPTDKTEVKAVVPSLTVNGKHFLASIYPGIDNPDFTQADLLRHILQYVNVQDSSYAPLFAFLKYSSATSIVVAKTLFDTQKAPFVTLVEGLANTFSGYKPEITEEIYNDFQKYVISSLDLDCPSIKYPVKVRVNKKKNIVVNYGVDFDVAKPENEDVNVIQDERNRIYGYNRKPTLTYYENGERKEFTVEDISNPTEVELEHFEQLSPAQKVQWIKQKFADSGIFNYIRVSLVNSYKRGKRKGMQTLQYTEQNIDSNVLYDEFKETFYNNNPLIVSAAIDLVKYAVQVEGFRMSATAINKLIDNSCLYNDFGSEGLGVINHTQNKMNDINSMVVLHNDYRANNDMAATLYENYLRSHPNSTSIKKFRLNKTNREKYGIPNKLLYGMFCFRYNHTFNCKDKAEVQNKMNSVLQAIGIKYYHPLTSTYETNKYIRIVEGKETTLYKIHDRGTFVMLTPLTNLEANENAIWSVNEDNNKTNILAPFAYDYIVDCFAQDMNSTVLKYEWLIDTVRKLFKTERGDQVFYKKR